MKRRDYPTPQATTGTLRGPPPQRKQVAGPDLCAPPPWSFLGSPPRTGCPCLWPPALLLAQQMRFPPHPRPFPSSRSGAFLLQVSCRAVHCKMFHWVEKKGRALLSLNHHLQEHTSLHLWSQEPEQRPVSSTTCLLSGSFPCTVGSVFESESPPSCSSPPRCCILPSFKMLNSILKWRAGGRGVSK